MFLTLKAQAIDTYTTILGVKFGLIILGLSSKNLLLKQI